MSYFKLVGITYSNTKNELWLRSIFKGENIFQHSRNWFLTPSPKYRSILQCTLRILLYLTVSWFTQCNVNWKGWVGGGGIAYILYSETDTELRQNKLSKAQKFQLPTCRHFCHEVHRTGYQPTHLAWNPLYLHTPFEHLRPGQQSQSVSSVIRNTYNAWPTKSVSSMIRNMYANTHTIWALKTWSTKSVNSMISSVKLVCMSECPL